MKTNLASLKAEHAGSSSTISHLEATIRDKDKHIEILQGQRQRSGEETDEELGRVKRAHEKLEGRLASLREQLSDKEVHEYMLYLYVVLLPGSIVIVLPYSSSGPRGGGGSPLHVYGLYGDVPLDMVRFSSSLSETGYIILPKSVLNGVHVLFPKQGNTIEAFVLNRVRVNLYPNIGRVPLPPPRGTGPDRVPLRCVHAVRRRRNTSKVRITLQVISWLPQGRKKSGNFTSSQGECKSLIEVREK